MSNKMNKNVVPENFTLGLVIVDAIPVVFFGASMIVAGMILNNVGFMIGALLCLFAGVCKVIWKLIVVLKRKNIWWLFMQMRIVMPIGMLVMILSVLLLKSTVSLPEIWAKVCSLPACIFFIAGLIGMGMMIVFAFTLDGSDVKSNWIEQITNGFAQGFFFVGLLIVLLG